MKIKNFLSLCQKSYPYSNYERFPTIFYENNVVLLLCESQFQACNLMLRPQEFFESPNEKFRNHYFTLEEYMHWYASEKNKKFSYFEDWNGFNINTDELRNFCNIYKNHFTENEKWLMNLLLLYRSEDVINYEPKYLIVCHKSSTNAIKHELAHALFDIDDKYKKLSLKYYNKYRPKDFNKKLLNTGGYCKKVLPSEYQAYMVQGMEYFCKDINIKIRNKLTEKVKSAFPKLYTLCKE